MKRISYKNIVSDICFNDDVLIKQIKQTSCDCGDCDECGTEEFDCNKTKKRYFSKITCDCGDCACDCGGGW